MASDFLGAFASLREIMKRHSAGMIVQADTPTDFTVIMRAIHPNKKPLWFRAATVATFPISTAILREIA
jgi:hypothetical protein